MTSCRRASHSSRAITEKAMFGGRRPLTLPKGRNSVKGHPRSCSWEKLMGRATSTPAGQPLCQPLECQTPAALLLNGGGQKSTAGYLCHRGNQLWGGHPRAGGTCTLGTAHPCYSTEVSHTRSPLGRKGGVQMEQIKLSCLRFTAPVP